MELQVGVKALLRNQEGKYLLIRVSPDKYPEIGPKWNIPGGRIHPGSTLIDNLKREIKEEIGLDLKDEPRFVAAQDILRVAGKHVVRLTYVVAIEGEPKLNEEHTEYKWFTLEEMKKISEKELDIYFKELLDKNYFD